MSRVSRRLLGLTRLCTRFPKTVIVLTICLTLVFAIFARRVERDTSMEKMLPADDPIRVFFDEFKTHFDVASLIVFGVEYDGGVFTPEVLAQVDRLSRRLVALPDIKRVQSLTTVENITSAGGLISVKPLADALPQTPEEIAAFERAARENDMIADHLIGKDGTATLITAQPDYQVYETDKVMIGYEEVRRIIDEDPGPGRIHLAGFPMVIALNHKNMDRDNEVMLPIIALVVVILLWVSFRTLRGVWIPLSVVAAAVIWTFGGLAIAGIKINIISTSIPIILVAMGIADGIHILHEYYHHLRLGAENRDAVVATMREMNAPVVMTSLTTAAGFLALSVSRIIPIREYGGAVAYGVMVAMVFSLTFIPAALVVLGRPKRLPFARAQRARLLERFSAAIGWFSLRHARAVVVGFVVILLATGVLSTFLKVRNNPVHYFRETSEIRQSDDFLNGNFPGTGELVVQVDAKAADAVKDPVLLEKIAQLADEVQRLTVVGAARSIDDFLVRMNYVLNDQDPRARVLPGSHADLGDAWTTDGGRMKIAQYLMLYEMSGGTDLAHYVDFPYQRANRIFHVKSNDSTDYQAIMDVVKPAVAAIFPPESYNVGITGPGMINLKIVQYLVLGQVMSLVASFVVVFLLLIILFRSFWDALVGSIPLVVTVTANFAVMVAAGIPLNMGTALIASVIIGVGVDYSIHFIHRYRLEAARNADTAQTVQATMSTSGRAIIFNAFAVGGGFAVLLFSSFLPVVYLGLLVPLVMLINAVAALVVIPAILNLRRARTSPPATAVGSSA